MIFSCDYCEDIFNTKQALTRHSNKCQEKKIFLVKEKEKEKNLMLQKELKKLKEQIIKLKAENKELRLKPVIINHNDNRVQNVTIKTYIKNTQAITVEALNSFVSKLTMNHIIDGGVGLANYYIQYIQPKHSIVCKDLSRQICMYKNAEEKIYKDPRLLKFIKDFSSSVHISARDLVQEFCKNDWIKDDLEKQRELMEIVKDISMAKTGNKAKFVPSPEVIFVLALYQKTYPYY